jgi:hypothetical protein
MRDSGEVVNCAANTTYAGAFPLAQTQKNFRVHPLLPMEYR